MATQASAPSSNVVKTRYRTRIGIAKLI